MLLDEASVVEQSHGLTALAVPELEGLVWVFIKAGITDDRYARRLEPGGDGMDMAPHGLPVFVLLDGLEALIRLLVLPEREVGRSRSENARH
ncbi:hypothetical protein [Pseudarthrobacter cellobiosi]|uniref:hypothetical protein n=1 Tax=Pseudarthrobacter cellobiosi TaxID=2953654 RepID=UPI00208E0D15|nr:hypothetical protein [Pseudarthrobacter sp. HLT1-5]